MSLNLDPIYLVWLFIAISAGLAFEAVLPDALSREHRDGRGAE